MKILIISNLYPPHEIGGYETRCRDMVDHLSSRGHEVRVLTSDHRVPGRSGTDVDHVKRSLKIHGMYGHPWLPILSLYALEQHNHRALIEQLTSFCPDVIHVWNMGGISKSLLLRLESCGIPVVYVISDHWIARSLRADVWLAWWNSERGALTKMVRSFFRWTGIKSWISRLTPTASWDRLTFEHISFCSAFLRDLTQSRGWNVSHGVIIHCGIRTGDFSVKQDYTDFKKLLWVGRLSEDKDPLTAVRALSHCKNTHCTLDLFGKGEPEYLAAIDREIESLGLAQRVTRKSATEKEMRQLYAQYDALLFTSNWGEPFALTPLEAMASGLPVITSLDGGQAELAKSGDNCLVAHAGDATAYATCIDELTANAELRQNLGKNGLKEARERFDLDVIFQQMEKFLLP